MPTLSDVKDQIEKGLSPETLSDPTITDYTSIIARAGREVLLPIDQDLLLAAIAVIQSGAITDALQEGTLTARDLSFLMSDRFGSVATMMFRLSVGLAAVEELQ